MQWNETKKISWYENFSAQPHQPFFALGIPLLAIFTLILLGQFSDVITLNISITQFHIYPLIFMIFIQFFLGFLFVVFPRFLMQAVVKPSVYMQLFYGYALGSIIYLIGLFTFKPLVFVGSLVLFAAQVWAFIILYDIFKKSVVPDKYDTKWILITYLTGIISHVLFLISFFNVSIFIEKLAIYSGFYLFLFALIFAISQRMILIFSKVKVPTYVQNKSKYIMEIIFVLLTLKVATLLMEDPRLNIIADLPLFLFFTYELVIRWKLPVTKVTPIVWILYLALAWIPVGFLLSTIESLAHILQTPFIFEKSVIHTFALGYFITILVGFGTRVVLGHSGRTPTADAIAVSMFMIIQFIVLVRIFAGLAINFGFDYIFWINTSAALLVIALFAWSARYLGILIKGHKPH